MHLKFSTVSPYNGDCLSSVAQNEYILFKGISWFK